jgi:presenilin-like A22 family membrane protease
MIFNVSLSLTLFLITLAVSLLYTRYESRVQSLFGGRKLRLRDVVLLVAGMGIMVTILAFIPKLDVIKVFFLCVYSLVFFLSTYLIVPRWYFAVLSPAVFVALYLLHWNIYSLNFFAILFAIFVSIYLGALFIWKTTAVFAALLITMDIIQVLGTKFMVVYGEKVLTLALPAMIIIPTFPSWFPEGRAFLGLGDVLLAGLLVIQTTKKYGKRFGLMTAIAIAAVFLLLETILLNFLVGYFPATVMVICGWLTALGARRLYKPRVLGAG